MCGHSDKMMSTQGTQCCEKPSHRLSAEDCVDQSQPSHKREWDGAIETELGSSCAEMQSPPEIEHCLEKAQVVFIEGHHLRTRK